MSGPEIKVFQLLLEIVKETSSIVRKDDLLSRKLQTAIKEGVYDGLGKKQNHQESVMQLVDDIGGIRELQNSIPLGNHINNESVKKNINNVNNKESVLNGLNGLKAQFQVAMADLKEKFSDDVINKTNIDSGQVKKMLTDVFSNLRSFDNFKVNDRRKRESQTKSEITPELIAFAFDKELQEELSEDTNCWNQILWNNEGKYEGEICGKISHDLGKKLRKLMFMILKKELPSSFFFLDFENIMKEFMSRGQELEKDAKTLAMKFLQPVTGADLKEILTPIVQIFEKPIFGNEKIDIIFNGILRFIIKKESLNKLATIVRQVQKEIILR